MQSRNVQCSNVATKFYILFYRFHFVFGASALLRTSLCLNTIHTCPFIICIYTFFILHPLSTHTFCVVWDLNGYLNVTLSLNLSWQPNSPFLPHCDCALNFQMISLDILKVYEWNYWKSYNYSLLIRRYQNVWFEISSQTIFGQIFNQPWERKEKVKNKCCLHRSGNWLISFNVRGMLVICSQRRVSVKFCTQYRQSFVCGLK